jgi:hypothetical protein
MLCSRPVTRPKPVRYDWGNGTTRVNVTLLAKHQTKSTIALEHRRLAGAQDAERMKAYCRQALAALRRELER